MEFKDEILDLPENDGNDVDFYVTNAGKRLANYILDRIGIYLVMFAIVAVENAVSPGDESSDMSAALGLSIVLMIPLYYALPEFLWGKTPAKFITGTTVVDEFGERISFMRALGRTLCRIIPFDAFSFLFSTPPVGWHDSISRTRVVNDDFFG